MAVAVTCHLGAAGPASINRILFSCCSEDLQKEVKPDGLWSGLQAVEGTLDVFLLVCASVKLLPVARNDNQGRNWWLRNSYLTSWCKVKKELLTQPCCFACSRALLLTFLNVCVLLGGSHCCQKPSLKVLSSAHPKCHLLEVQPSEAALQRSFQETHLHAMAICFWKTLAAEFCLVKMTSFTYTLHLWSL